MQDMSGIMTGITGGSSMASGSTAPIPDFGSAGSDSQNAAPELPVPPLPGMPQSDMAHFTGDAQTADYADLWQDVQGIG